MLDFAIAHGIALKAIAFVRPNNEPDFYGGEWVDPEWISALLAGRGGRFQLL